MTTRTRHSQSSQIWLKIAFKTINSSSSCSISKSNFRKHFCSTVLTINWTTQHRLREEEDRITNRRLKSTELGVMGANIQGQTLPVSSSHISSANKNCSRTIWSHRIAVIALIVAVDAAQVALNNIKSTEVLRDHHSLRIWAMCPL